MVFIDVVGFFYSILLELVVVWFFYKIKYENIEYKLYFFRLVNGMVDSFIYINVLGVYFECFCSLKIVFLINEDFVII